MGKDYRGKITLVPDPEGLAQKRNGLPTLRDRNADSGELGRITTMANGYNGGRGTSANMGPKSPPPMANRVKSPGRDTGVSARTPKAGGQAAVAAANRNADNADGIRPLKTGKVGAVTTTVGFGKGNRKWSTHPGIAMAKGTNPK